MLQWFHRKSINIHIHTKLYNVVVKFQKKVCIKINEHGFLLGNVSIGLTNHRNVYGYLLEYCIDQLDNLQKLSAIKYGVNFLPHRIFVSKTLAMNKVALLLKCECKLYCLRSIVRMCYDSNESCK